MPPKRFGGAGVVPAVSTEPKEVALSPGSTRGGCWVNHPSYPHQNARVPRTCAVLAGVGWAADTGLECSDHGLHPVADAKLRHHATQVCLDGGFAKEERLGDLCIGTTGS